jgi:hypothetical protein
MCTCNIVFNCSLASQRIEQGTNCCSIERVVHGCATLNLSIPGKTLGGKLVWCCN